VFWHTGGGVQVPAGTVEDGESFEEAARREVFEETDLRGLELIGHVGVKTYDLTGGWSVLRREVELLVRPQAEAQSTRWKLGRSLNIGVIERRDGFARIVYSEEDIESETRMVYARFEGWVRAEDLYERQERRFYHFRAPSASPDKWTTIENGVHEFHLYWLPLVPKPGVLVESNQAWLDEFYDALVAGVLQR
jgi:8-oxo-dGTP pyrophosphatase MutT (NUDIX family)